GRLERGAKLSAGHGDSATAADAATGSRDKLEFLDGAQRRVAHAGTVRIIDFTVTDFLHATEAVFHHFHVGGDDGVTKATELFDVLFLNRGEKEFFRNVIE